MLFTVYSRFVPNLTRQDGSAIDRLLATRFASGNSGANEAPAKAPKPSPPGQPPPLMAVALA